MKEIEEEGEKEKKEKVTKKKGNIKSVKHLSLGKRFDTYASAICMCLGKEAEKMREEYVIRRTRLTVYWKGRWCSWRQWLKL